MMGKIILCEGETDAILISYYLQQFGWSFLQSQELNKLKLPQIGEKRKILWYRKEPEQYLAIYPVGGCEEINPEVEEVIQFNKKFNYFFEDLIVVADHDDAEADTRISELGCVIGKLLGQDDISIEAGKIKAVELEDPYKEMQTMKVLCMFIPVQGDGALETFVLQMFSQVDEENSKVANVSGAFVEGIRSKKYLTRRREKTKAKLSVALSVFSPDRTFTTINEFLREIDWNRYKEFNKTFSVLNQLVEE